MGSGRDKRKKAKGVKPVRRWCSIACRHTCVSRRHHFGHTGSRCSQDRTQNTEKRQQGPPPRRAGRPGDARLTVVAPTSSAHKHATTQGGEDDIDALLASFALQDAGAVQVLTDVPPPSARTFATWIPGLGQARMHDDGMLAPTIVRCRMRSSSTSTGVSGMMARATRCTSMGTCTCTAPTRVSGIASSPPRGA